MRLAFLGVSHWHAAMHAEAAKATGAQIASAWDPTSESTKLFADRFGCAVASSLDEAIANVDLVVVMGRPFEIAEYGLAVINKNVPLLIEKPIGISASAVVPLIEASNHVGSFVAVALPHGLGMRAALAELDRMGRLGDLSHSYFRLINGPPQRYVDDNVGWVLDRSIGGGGALRNLGIHGVSAFLSLAGDQAVTIESASFGRPIHGTNVEDYAAVVLRAGDGVLGIVEAGYTFASMTGGIFEWRVSGRNATLTDLGDRITVATLDDGGERDVAVSPPAQRYNDVMAVTIARLASGQAPAVSLIDTWRAMDIIDRCYALAGKGD